MTTKKNHAAGGNSSTKKRIRTLPFVAVIEENVTGQKIVLTGHNIRKRSYTTVKRDYGTKHATIASELDADNAIVTVYTLRKYENTMNSFLEKKGLDDIVNVDIVTQAQFDKIIRDNQGRPGSSWSAGDEDMSDFRRGR